MGAVEMLEDYITNLSNDGASDRICDQELGTDILITGWHFTTAS